MLGHRNFRKFVNAHDLHFQGQTVGIHSAIAKNKRRNLDAFILAQGYVYIFTIDIRPFNLSQILVLRLQSQTFKILLFLL